MVQPRIAIPDDLQALEGIFAERRILTSQVGFYNDPNFLTAERDDPAFLEFYAAFVRLRQRDDVYNALVRRIVPLIAEIVAQEIEKDGQKGVCIDASMMLTKMLEKEGVWCYCVNGGLTIQSPTLPNSTHFWPMDIGAEMLAGHVWLVAPPFEIVDVSLSCQPYTRGEAALLPSFLAIEDANPITPTVRDYCSSELLHSLREQYGPLPGDIHLRIAPALKRPLAYFPSFEVNHGSTKLRYATGGVSVSDAPSLEAITSRRWNGLLAAELYEQSVKPAIQSLIDVKSHEAYSHPMQDLSVPKRPIR